MPLLFICLLICEDELNLCVASNRLEHYCSMSETSVIFAFFSDKQVVIMPLHFDSGGSATWFSVFSALHPHGNCSVLRNQTFLFFLLLPPKDNVRMFKLSFSHMNAIISFILYCGGGFKTLLHQSRVFSFFFLNRIFFVFAFSSWFLRLLFHHIFTVQADVQRHFHYRRSVSCLILLDFLKPCWGYAGMCPFESFNTVLWV